jgi:hypothetical protein
MRFSTLTILILLGILAQAFGCGDDSAGPDLQPVASSLAPDSGTVGTQVAITGSDFIPGATVTFSGLPAIAVEVPASTTVLAYAPDGITAGSIYDVRLTNPGGKSSDLPQSFRAVGPVLQSVNGVSKPSGIRGSTIIFEGKSFGDLADRGTVWFSDDSGTQIAATVVSHDNWTDEFIVTTVPNAAGDGPVWIETATGVTDSIAFRVSDGATFSPSQINWTVTTSLPSASQGLEAVFLSGEEAGTTNVLYVSGGADGSLSPSSAVWRASIDGTGAIHSWASETSLPASRAFHCMTLATPFNALVDTTDAGHLYVLGGMDGTGAPQSSVYRATIASDRSVGGWGIENALPEPLHSAGVVLFRSWLYVIGGATSGNAPMASVYRAPIAFDGRLGPWEAQTPLPAPRAYAAAVQFAGTLYVVGGDGGTVAPGSASTSNSESSRIYYNPLDIRNRTLAVSWTQNPSSLIKSVAKHTALAAGGTILVSGGVYNGAGSSATEHQYASFDLDGTIGSFGGATGSQTIGGSSGAGGSPFFNHAAIVYVDGVGAAHVVILGGAEIGDPSTALDGAYYY